MRFVEQSYDSLSTAGGIARKSVTGAPLGQAYPQTNGWTFWFYRDAATGELRQQYLRRNAIAGADSRSRDGIVLAHGAALATDTMVFSVVRRPGGSRFPWAHLGGPCLRPRRREQARGPGPRHSAGAALVAAYAQ